MGKRKSKDANYLREKIRKLEDKLKNLPQGLEEDSNEEESPCRPSSQQYTSPPLATRTMVVEESPTIIINDAENNCTEDVLPVELLQALGMEGEENTEVGEAIRPELALRWTRIMQTGLNKESREAINKKYPTPINFPRAVAPLMNPEVSATLSDSTLKRDKRICYRQNIIGKLMTCLGISLSKVLTGNISSKVLVEEMSDAAKLAAEIYHQDSSSRKFFALAGVNKVVQDAVRTATPDGTLFGTDCAEKIRAAQAIQKAGSMIKTTEKKTFKPGTQKKQLNWRGPPQYQQQQLGRGGHQPQQHQHQRQPRPDQTRWKTQKSVPSSSKSRYRK